MKSKASASSTSNTSVSETVPKSMRGWARRRSGVFENDAFDHVRDVLALVGRRFQVLVYRLELDELTRVGFVAEQFGNRAAHDFVGFGFEFVDFLADLEDGGCIGHGSHESDGRLHALGA